MKHCVWPLLLWYIVSFLIGYIVIRLVYRMLLRGGHVRKNFQDKDIPTSVGVAFVLMVILLFLLLFGFTSGIFNIDLFGSCAPFYLFSYVFQMFMLTCGFAVLGLLDDMLPTRERGGFRGHFGRLIKEGVASTAIIKAFFGLALCLCVALFLKEGPWYQIPVNTLILALCANAINLLDVKPGRALKGFLSAFIIIFALSFFAGSADSSPGATVILLVPFTLWALAYWPLDLRCQAMMGDAGSNVLGAVLGLLVVWNFGIVFKLIVLALLIVFHLICELGSLSAIIERVPPLRWLDDLGVKKDSGQEKSKIN